MGEAPPAVSPSRLRMTRPVTGARPEGGLELPDRPWTAGRPSAPPDRGAIFRGSVAAPWPAVRDGPTARPLSGVLREDDSFVAGERSGSRRRMNCFPFWIFSTETAPAPAGRTVSAF